MPKAVEEKTVPTDDREIEDVVDNGGRAQFLGTKKARTPGNKEEEAVVC